MNKHFPQMVGIGSTVYDTLMVTDGFPSEDKKCQGLETKVQGGGPCATALVAARKLGVSAAYLGAVGADPFGEFMLSELAHYGVDVSCVQRRENAISFHAVVLLNRRNATRTCVWNPGTVAPPTPDELDEELLRHARALHLDGHMLETSIYAAKRCREWGVKVSLDAGGIYPGVEDLLPFVDYLIPSEEFALAVSGEACAQDAAKKLFHAYKPELVVITQGARGGILYDGTPVRAYESYPVEVVDSNGCGDTFHGAFVAAMIGGMRPDSACRYASAAAAIKCTRLGARLGMPTDEECRAFLRERNVELD